MRRIAFLTDVHLDEDFTYEQGVDPKRNLETVMADLLEWNVDEIVFGGDIGAGSSHAYFFNILSRYEYRIVLGNHDRIEEVSRHFGGHDKAPELYYRAEYGSYTALFLDTSSEMLSEAQLSWIAGAVQDAGKLVLFMHHPLLPVAAAADRIYPLQNREALRSLLAQSGKQITIFCGHYHTDDECVEGNICQVVTRALSFQLVKGTDTIAVDRTVFGYRIIDLYEDSIKTQTVEFSNISG